MRLFLVLLLFTAAFVAAPAHAQVASAWSIGLEEGGVVNYSYTVVDGDGNDVDLTAKSLIRYIVKANPTITAETLATYDCDDAEMTCADGSWAFTESVANLDCDAYCWHELQVQEAGEPSYRVWLKGPLQVRLFGISGGQTQTGTLTVTTGASTLSVTAVSQATSLADSWIGGLTEVGTCTSGYFLPLHNGTSYVKIDCDNLPSGGGSGGDSFSANGTALTDVNLTDSSEVAVAINRTASPDEVSLYLVPSSIGNGKLVNSTVSYGGVSLSLGGEDATPAFDLQDATGYPALSLTGTLADAQLPAEVPLTDEANAFTADVEMSRLGIGKAPEYLLEMSTAHSGFLQFNDGGQYDAWAVVLGEDYEPGTENVSWSMDIENGLFVNVGSTYAGRADLVLNRADFLLRSDDVTFGADAFAFKSRDEQDTHLTISSGGKVTLQDSLVTSVGIRFAATGSDPILSASDGVLNLSSGALQVGGVAVSTGAHTTDTGPVPDCVGTTTYQDGEGGCDDLSAVYQPLNSNLTDFAGKSAPTGAVVGTTDTQTLTDKTIDGGNNTLQNIPVSATDLTAGRSLTLTSGDVAADAELYTSGTTFYLESPVTDEDLTTVWVAPNAVTLTEISCEIDAGTSVAVDFAVDDGTPAAVNGSEISCTTTWATDSTLGGDTSMAAGDRLDINVGTVTGSVGKISLFIKYTIDD